MKKLLLVCILLSLNYCASSSPQNAASGGDEKSMIDMLKEKAESEEGKKYIEMAKEKLKDKETQDKLKGLLGNDKVPTK